MVDNHCPAPSLRKSVLECTLTTTTIWYLTLFLNTHSPRIYARRSTLLSSPGDIFWSPLSPKGQGAGRTVPADLHLLLRAARGVVGEHQLGLVHVRHQPVEVVAELLERRVERHLVGRARQLRAARRRRRHHPHVLRTRIRVSPNARAYRVWSSRVAWRLFRKYNKFKTRPWYRKYVSWWVKVGISEILTFIPPRTVSAPER